MSALDTAISIAKVFEGFYSKPYLCPAGVWTIGFGTTVYPSGIRVTKLDKQISKDLGEEYLLYEMKYSLAAASRLCPVLLLEENENRLAAITDFVYNLGSGRLQQSTLRRRINETDWEEVKVQLGKWVFGGGKKLPGLVKRRKVEARLI